MVHHRAQGKLVNTVMTIGLHKTRIVDRLGDCQLLEYSAS
jgi:hypothetical protein